MHDEERDGQEDDAETGEENEGPTCADGTVKKLDGSSAHCAQKTTDEIELRIISTVASARRE